MMGIVLANNAHTTLAADASSTDTVIYVEDIDSFPALGADEYFYCTLERTSGAMEIVKVTQVNASSFDVVRGQESTIPISFPIGSRAELKITVQSLEDQFDDAVESHIEDTAYGLSWDSSQLVATKNALYDKIETLLPSASYTAADVLAKLLTVDGSGSLLDADFLDGMSSAAYAQLAAANVFAHTTGNTFNGRINIDPSYAVYDQFATVEAPMINFGSGSLTVAASKELDFLRADNTFTIGNGSVAAFATLNLTSSSSSHSGSNMYGALYGLTNAGPGTTKALYGRAIGSGSSTGPIVGVVAAAQPGASTSLSASAQISINSAAKKVDYALWISETNASDQVDYGLVAGTGVTVNQAFVQMAAVGSGNFLRLKNSTASADLFYVTSTGALFTNSTIDLGHASDTTLARVSAGDVSVEGNLLYRAGGTDVPVLDGGTGASDAATARTNLGIGTVGTLSSIATANIDNNAVTLAKMATMATDSILGRATASTGNVEVLTALPFAFTGDVTRPADSNAQTIANDAVTYAKMQNVSATSRVLGRITSGSGDVEELTGANIRTIASISYGTYTPTLTGVANVDSVAAYQAHYTQIGDVVHVAGKFDLDPTAGASTWTRFRLSLPVASNLVNAHELAGTTVSYGGAVNGYGALLGDATNDTAEVSCYPVATTNTSWYYTFTYRVL